jgi:hypothetical protein
METNDVYDGTEEWNARMWRARDEYVRAVQDYAREWLKLYHDSGGEPAALAAMQALAKADPDLFKMVLHPERMGRELSYLKSDDPAS